MIYFINPDYPDIQFDDSDYNFKFELSRTLYFSIPQVPRDATYNPLCSTLLFSFFPLLSAHVVSLLLDVDV